MKKLNYSMMLFAIVLGFILLFSSCAGTGVDESQTGADAPLQTEVPADEDKEIEFDDFSYLKRDGIWHLSLKKELPEETESPFGSLVIRTSSIKFSSFEEMIDTVKNGKFTDDQLRIMSFWTKDEYGILLFDLDDPLKPYYPDSLSVDGVTWSGTSFSLTLKDVQENCIYLKWFATEERYDDYFAYRYTNDLTGGSTISNTLVSSENGINVIRHETEQAVMKVVRFEPQAGVFVNKRFMTDTKGHRDLEKTFPISETLPYRIHVFHNHDGLRFAVMQEMPPRDYSDEELLSIGFAR